MTKEEAINYLQQLYPNGGHCWLDKQRIEAIGMAVEALKEEPVSDDFEKIVEEIAEPTILNAYGTKELARRLRNTICCTSVSEDLEEAADNALNNVLNTHEIVNVRSCLEMFKFGAKWQEEQDQSTIELAEDHAMLAGMEKMKEQMMAKAIDATVTDIRTYKKENEIDFTIMLEKGIVPYELEDELKVIVIKED